MTAAVCSQSVGVIVLLLAGIACAERPVVGIEQHVLGEVNAHVDMQAADVKANVAGAKSDYNGDQASAGAEAQATPAQGVDAAKSSSNPGSLSEAIGRTGEADNSTKGQKGEEHGAKKGIDRYIPHARR